MLKAAHIPPYFKQLRSAHVAGGHPALGSKKTAAAAVSAQANNSSSANRTAVILYVPPSHHIASGVPPEATAARALTPPTVSASPIKIASALPAFTCSPFETEAPSHVTFAPLPDMVALRAAHKATQKPLFAKAWSALLHAANVAKIRMIRAVASMWLAVATFFKVIAHRS